MIGLTEFIQKYNGQKNVGNTNDNKGQCVGLVVNTLKLVYNKLVCQKVLRDFKKAIISVRQAGQAAETTPGKIIPSSKNTIQTKLRTYYVIFTGGKISKKTLNLQRSMFGLGGVFLNLISVNTVTIKNLWNSLITVTYTNVIFKIGNGYVEAATLLKTKGTRT